MSNEAAAIRALSPDARRRALMRLLGEESTPARHPFTARVNPTLGRMLEALRLDVAYARGEGCWLYDAQGRRYLDATAAYGALPFGHNPPEIWAAVDDLRRRGEPNLVQPSLLDAAGALAERLVAVAPAGLEHVAFANSGAESIEAALKLCRAATGRAGVLATDDGFHGKTLGALSATGRSSYQEPFGAPVAGFSRVPFGDADAVEDALASGAIGAFVVEPIQGEGGVNVPPPGYLARVRDACTRHGALLVVDEVQTGLGRTGTLFACEAEGVVPDLLTLAKALGGGLVPAGAVLCSPAAWSERFARLHTSTFAANAIAARVGLRVLELLTPELLDGVAAGGERLLRGLRELRDRHPQLLTDVRGRGHLIGIELTDDSAAFRRQSLLGALAEQEALAAFACSDLLHRGGVRVAPTLFGGRVIRIELPLVATAEMCDMVVEAVAGTLEVLERCDTTAALGLPGRPASTPVPAARAWLPRPAPDEAHWAFVLHPLELASYRDFDAGLAAVGDDALASLVRRLERVRGPGDPGALVLGRCRLRSETGAAAAGELIGVPLTADELLDLSARAAAERVGEAVAIARRRGAQIVGLGAYTSIVTDNAVALGDVGVPVTTGNGLTVAAGVDGLAAMAGERPLCARTAGVVGATGSIGRAASVLLAREVPRIVLLGSPRAQHDGGSRLRETARAIVADAGSRAHPGSVTAAAGRGLAALEAEGRITIADDAGALRGCDAILTATSTPHAFIGPDLLAPGAIVCDVAQPPNVLPHVAAERPDVTVFDGGILHLPGGADLGVRFGLRPGLVYACMAETMLLALERRFDQVSADRSLDVERIAGLSAAAARHGFRVAVGRAPERVPS